MEYLAYLSLTVNQANDLLLEKDYRLYEMEMGGFFKAPRLVYAHRSNILTKNVRESEKVFISRVEEKLLTLEAGDSHIGVELSDFLNEKSA